MASGVTSLPVPDEILHLIFEHCDLAALRRLRQVCRCFKRAADTAITTTSHLPLPTPGELCTAPGELCTAPGELYMQARSSTDEANGVLMVLEEGWAAPDLLSREGAITQTLAHANPPEYAEYNESTAREYLRKDGEFTMVDPSDGNDFYGENFDPECFGWDVSLIKWSESCSRASCDNVLQAIQSYNADGYDECDDGGLHSMDMLHRVWGLLLQQPQVLVHVKMSHSWFDNYPTSGKDEYVLIQTSKGKKYQLYKNSEVCDLDSLV